MLRTLVLGATALAFAAGPVAAQDGAGAFHVSPHVGYTLYKEATGLKPGVNFGMDALYFFSKNIGVGVLLDFARPSTDSSFFPVEMSFGGSSFPDNPDGATFIYGVSMPVTIAQYQLMAQFQFGDRFQPFINAGVGGYTMYLDPQVALGNENFTNLGFSAGLGFSFEASSYASIRLEARDYVFTKFDRANFQVQNLVYDWTVSTGSFNQPVRYPDVLPAQEEFSGSAHNWNISLGFTFTPGGR